jgi:hypothetical protein
MVVLILSLVSGVGAFFYYANSEYNINKDFESIPLQFDPEDSSSTYQSGKATITVYGGFVKGIQKGAKAEDSIVLRALSPLPVIQIKSEEAYSASLILENINPDFYAQRIAGSNLPIAKIKPNTIQIKADVSSGQTLRIDPAKPDNAEDLSNYKYIVLGDNRDGYDTFEQIIQQINGEAPILVIDNGDLVFSGKPNQYRLFDQIVSKMSSTLCTTMGNHDIRGDGRPTYTKLYGPAYYSFDFADRHFVFVDSSPGWAEKKAISDEQYAWLERDLAKAEGKHIFVITHIPPSDPRSNLTPNEIPNYVNEVKSNAGWLEQKLNQYSASKSMDHGFQDPLEAARFEKIMSRYHVDTVYLSHIHSYLEYTKDGVRYMITGGAGAELLSDKSYYHYMIMKMAGDRSARIIELPSPGNQYILRYAAAAQLFANAIYKENPVAVVLVILGFVLLLIVLILKIYLWKKHLFNNLGVWLKDTAKFSKNRFKEIFSKKS